MMPLRKTPSNVPAPPMLAIGAPRLGMSLRLVKSAPMRVPKVPAIDPIEFRKAVDFISPESFLSCDCQNPRAEKYSASSVGEKVPLLALIRNALMAPRGEKSCSSAIIFVSA